MRQLAEFPAGSPDATPVVVRYSRRKLAPMVAACYALALGGAVGLATGLGTVPSLSLIAVFGLLSVAATRALLADTPGLVLDHEGIHSPANGMSAPWGEVVAIGHEALSFNGSTTHEFHVSVRDGNAVLRRKPRDTWITPGTRRKLLRYRRFEVGLDDRDLPPEQIFAAAEERFRAATPADPLETFAGPGGREVRRRSSLAPDEVPREHAEDEHLTARQKWEGYLGIGVTPRSDEERDVYRARRVMTGGCLLLLAGLSVLSVIQALGLPSAGRSLASIVLVVGGVAAFLVRMWRL